MSVQYSQRVNISNSEFFGNEVEFDGGAIYYDFSIQNTLNNCYFDNNVASLNGGAFTWTFSNGNITNSIFKRNSAAINGGAIYIDISNTSSMIEQQLLTNCNFTQNNAKNGGALYFRQVIVYMDNAVKKANVYVEQIGKVDSKLAASLKDQINSLYNEYLVHVKSYSHQWQYIKFVEALNKLFEGISLPAYTVNNNPGTVKYLIPKEDIKVLDQEKAYDVIQNAMDAIRTNADEISKTNLNLGNWIKNQAMDIRDKYSGGIYSGDVKSYNDFINELNKLIKNSVGFSNSLKISDDVLKTMGNSDIINLIRMKVDLNSDLKLSKQILAKLNQPNLSKNDLIDILNTFNSYLIKESNIAMKDKALTDGSIYFKTNSPDLLSDVNKLRNVITNDLGILKYFSLIYMLVFLNYSR